jgi:hypothetical protein
MREAQADVFRPMLHRATKKGDIRNHSNLSIHVLGKKVSQNKDGILIQKERNESLIFCKRSRKSGVPLARLCGEIEKNTGLLVTKLC